MAEINGFPSFDPTVALGVRPPTAPTMENSLGQMTSLVDLQTKMQQNQMLRLQMLARQQAGEIMANAPSIEEGVKALAADPLTSAYAPEVASTMQTIWNSQVSTQGAQQEQATTGLGAVIKGLLPSLNDPSTFDANVATWAATLSPSARASVEKALPSLRGALVDGLPEGEAGLDTFQQRLSAMMLAAGVGADTVRASTGALAPSLATMTGQEGRMITQMVGGDVTGTIPAGSGSNTGTLAVGPSQTESAESAALGGTASQIQTEINETASSIPSGLKSIRTMADALKEFQSGGGANVRQALAKALQALKNAGMSGITQEMIDGAANGDLGAQQVFDANIRPFVTNQLKMAVQGTGNVMRPEVDAFMQMADSTTDPEALTSLLNKALYVMQVGYDKTQKWTEFRKAVKSGELPNLELSDFQSWYAGQLDESKLPAKTNGGLSFEPIPLGQARGTGAPAAGASPAGRPSLDSFFGGQ